MPTKKQITVSKEVMPPSCDLFDVHDDKTLSENTFCTFNDESCSDDFCFIKLYCKSYSKYLLKIENGEASVHGLVQFYDCFCHGRK